MTYFRELLVAYAATLREVTALEVAGTQLRQKLAAANDEKARMVTNMQAAQAQIEALEAEAAELEAEWIEKLNQLVDQIADLEDERDDLLLELEAASK